MDEGESVQNCEKVMDKSMFFKKITLKQKNKKQHLIFFLEELENVELGDIQFQAIG
jgi:hypothetical protein